MKTLFISSQNMAELRTEALLFSVLNHSGASAADHPIPGPWSFVASLEHVHAEVTSGTVSLISLTDAKQILRLKQKQYLPVVLGRCGSNLIWGYMTRRFAQLCSASETHNCDDHFVLTVQNFLPAVLNSSTVHLVDTTTSMKINVDNYATPTVRLYMARLCICDYVTHDTTPIMSLSDSVISTTFTWEATIYRTDDLSAPIFYNLESLQTADALKQIKLTSGVHSLFCFERAVMDDIGFTPTLDGFDPAAFESAQASAQPFESAQIGELEMFAFGDTPAFADTLAFVDSAAFAESASALFPDLLPAAMQAFSPLLTGPTPVLPPTEVFELSKPAQPLELSKPELVSPLKRRRRVKRLLLIHRKL